MLRQPRDTADSRALSAPGTHGSAKEMELNRAKQMLEADGLRISYFEAGQGDPIIVVRPEEGELGNSLLASLADSHRIITLELSSDNLTVAKLKESLPHILTTLGIRQCSLMGISAGARAALALAIAARERIERLILLSPLQVSESGEVLDLAEVETPTLILVGTRDTAAAIEIGRRCRQGIRSCHLSFVYGAGHALAGDRLEACLNPIVEFLEQGEQFIIFRESQLIRP